MGAEPACGRELGVFGPGPAAHTWQDIEQVILRRHSETPAGLNHREELPRPSVQPARFQRVTNSCGPVSPAASSSPPGCSIARLRRSQSSAAVSAIDSAYIPPPVPKCSSAMSTSRAQGTAMNLRYPRKRMFTPIREALVRCQLLLPRMTVHQK